MKIILYPLIFIASFVFFVYWMFPMEAVQSRIINAMEDGLGPDYSVHIDSIGTYWFTGASLENLTITHRVQGKDENFLKAERVTARAGIFSLLLGSPTVSFHAKMGDASVKGSVHQSEVGWSLDCSFSDLDLSQFPILQQTTGLNLSSQIEGEAQIYYDAKQPLKTSGKVDITFDKLQLKAGEVPLGEMGTFPLPDLSLASGNSVLKIQIDKGALNLDAFALKGEDFNLDVTGKIFLAPTVSKYRINLQGKFKFSPKLWGVLDPILPEKWAEDLKKQKGSDDNLPLSISGQFASPQIFSGAIAIFPFKPF